MLHPAVAGTENITCQLLPLGGHQGDTVRHVGPACTRQPTVPSRLNSFLNGGERHGFCDEE